MGWWHWPRALSGDPKDVPPFAWYAAHMRATTSSPPSNYRSPEAIRRWHERKLQKVDGDALKMYRDCALDPKFGQIVCVGIAFNQGDPEVIWEQDERSTLVTLAGHLSVYDPEFLIAHHGDGFDFPFVWERAVYHQLFGLARDFAQVPYGQRRELGMPAPRRALIDSKRLWSTTGPSSLSLSMLLQGAGIVGEWSNDKIDGSRVLDALLDDRHDDVRAHCRHDIQRLQALWYEALSPATGIK